MYWKIFLTSFRLIVTSFSTATLMRNEFPHHHRNTLGTCLSLLRFALCANETPFLSIVLRLDRYAIAVSSYFPLLLHNNPIDAYTQLSELPPGEPTPEGFHWFRLIFGKPGVVDAAVSSEALGSGDWCQESCRVVVLVICGKCCQNVTRPLPQFFKVGGCRISSVGGNCYDLFCHGFEISPWY